MVWETHVLPLCAWALVAGNTLVYRCAHGHSWREIPLFTDVRMGTRGRKYPCLPMCAWALVAGNTLGYHCEHGHSWQEIPLFTYVRMSTRGEKYYCLSMCAIALVPVSFGVNVKITLCFS